MGLLNLVWNGLKGLGKLLVLPIVAIRERPRFPTWLLWGLHLALVALALGGLGWLGYWLGLDGDVAAHSEFLRRTWLPLLCLLTYAGGWVAWWLVQQLRAPAEQGAHPDLDEAWQEAQHALDRAGIDLAATPLYLVLGKPAGPELTFFQAAHMPLAVAQTASGEQPLRVFAQPDAVYVCLSGVSLLADMARRLATVRQPEPAPSRAAVVAPRAVPQPARTLVAAAASGASSAAARSTGAALAERPTTVSAPNDLAPAARSAAALDELESLTRAAQEDLAVPASMPEQLRADDVQHHAARLDYVCQRIARSRAPYCPVNGVVVLLPYAAFTSDASAAQCAAALEQDLRTVGEATRVACPVVSVVCDLERAPGGHEFLARFPAEQRDRRLGAQLPLVDHIDERALRENLELATRWSLVDMAAGIVHRLFEFGGADEAARTAAADGNVALYRLLSDLRELQPRLSRCLTRALSASGVWHWRLCGLYLAATGADTLREQAFAAGIPTQLAEVQDAVAWTRDALEEDAAWRRWTVAGYTGLVGFVALLATVLIRG
ncbi:MAG: type VI secretion protein IcmF/TssM N-terminal domain-containing protein [Pirellulales bacterium]